jgi:broad specificity phosphatase PhoE
MIYLVRHGETQANVDVVFAGPNFNSPLTENGREQAYAEGERILQDNITIDHIFTSPADRAVQTAEIIAAVIGVDQEQSKLPTSLRSGYYLLQTS